MTNKILYTAVATGALLFSACQKDDDVAPQNGTQNSTMEVRMTDAPANFESLTISMTEVEVYREGSGWIDLDTKTESFNVLDLNGGNETVIAHSSNISAGVYTRLRITMNQNVNLVTLASTGIFGNQTGGSFELNWMSSNTVEIEINERIEVGQQASILVDFDAARSIVYQSGNYYVKPVIRYVRNAGTGIQGRVDGSAQAMIMVKSGDFEASTAVNAEGKFLLRGVENGTYEVTVDYLAEVNGDWENKQKKIQSVAVVDGQITQMGTINLD